MKNYYIRGLTGSSDYLSLLDETDGVYAVRIYRDQDGYEKVIDDVMSRELFESCLRTGYILEMEEAPQTCIA